MTLKEYAEMLNGRKYGFNLLSKEEIQIAKNNGFVIVYGESDDLMEFDGAFRDEADCYEGGTVYVTETGLFRNECESDCKYAQEARKKHKTITAIWNEDEDENDGFTWSYETDIPHETFDIMEDGEKYCRGIVFDIKSLKATLEETEINLCNTCINTRDECTSLHIEYGTGINVLACQGYIKREFNGD